MQDYGYPKWSHLEVGEQGLLPLLVDYQSHHRNGVEEEVAFHSRRKKGAPQALRYCGYARAAGSHAERGLVSEVLSRAFQRFNKYPMRRNIYRTSMIMANGTHMATAQQIPTKLMNTVA